MSDHKVCIKCIEGKPLNAFKINSRGKLKGSCIECDAAYQKAYKDANRVSINKYIRAYRNATPRAPKADNICSAKWCQEHIVEYKGIVGYCKSHAFDKFNNIKL
jgi:hypothetical protein